MAGKGMRHLKAGTRTAQTVQPLMMQGTRSAVCTVLSCEASDLRPSHQRSTVCPHPDQPMQPQPLHRRASVLPPKFLTVQ